MPEAPVLLITGVGMAAAASLRTVPVLSEHFRVLAVQPGGSPDGRPDTIAAFADEAVAALEEAGAAAAHVYGLSFGGMVAQELALRHPARVRSLVLGATSGGGALRVGPEPAARDFLARRSTLPPVEALWASVPYSYSQRTRRRCAQRIGEDIAARLRGTPLDPELQRRQRDAATHHDAGSRLNDIAVPTLILHGEEDRLVPVANAFKLRDAIPGAQLVVLDEAAHVYPTDAPEADERAAAFFRAQRVSRRRRPPSGSGRAARA